jgi:uncharacterized protein (DUF433 family)
MVLAETQVVPMKVDRDGVIRVGDTRVRLDTVIYAFNDGYTAEEIVTQYPVLKLADVYAVIAYYLNNRVEVDEYLKQRAEAAAKIRQEIEAKPEYKSFRERLLARRHFTSLT